MAGPKGDDRENFVVDDHYLYTSLTVSSIVH